MSALSRARHSLARLIGGASSDLPQLVRQLEAERASLTDAQAVAAVGSWETDLRTLAVTWSAETRRIFETGPEFRPTHQGFLDLVHPDDRAAVDAAFMRSVGTSGSWVIEHRILMADGRIKHVQERWRAFADAAGQPLRAVGTSQDITERKAAEEALRESDERFRQLADHITDALWIRSADMRTLHYISPSFERIWGRSVASLYADPHKWSDFIVPEDRERVLDAFRAIGEAPPLDVEYRIARPDGDIRWVRVRSFKVRDAAGVVIRHTGIVTDITERRRVEAALRASMEEFRTLAESVPQMVWITRADGWNEYFNQQWVDYTGLSREESAGHGWARPFHPADRPRAEAAWRHAVATIGTYSVECLLRRSDGIYRWWLIRGAPLRESDGTVRKWFGTCTDIHDLKLAELEVVRTNRALAMLGISAGPSADTGPAFFELLASNLTAAVGGYAGVVAELLPGEPPRLRTIAAVVAGETVANFDYAPGGTFCESLLSADTGIMAGLASGQVPPPLEAAAPGARAYLGRRLIDAAGQRLGVAFVLFRDPPEDRAFTTATLQIFAARAASEIERQHVDARVREQAALLLRAQRLESIGTLAGGIAHDLNNMLTPILMSIDMLRESITDDGSRSLLATMRTSAQRGADLVKQVLAFARGVEGQRVRVDLTRVTLDLGNVLRATLPKSITIVFDPAPAIWDVTGDPTQIHQVLMNLCVNARDAMPGGGRLTITIDNLMLDEAAVTAHAVARPGAYVRLRVADSGVGIPSDLTDRVFEPFFTTKAIGEGTGLGLSTSLAIVRSHGGSIQLDSPAGGGTTVDVWLPADTVAAEVSTAVEEPAPPQRSGGDLVLVVDDEDGILKVAHRLLERHGYRVLLAGNGAEALSLYRSHGHEIAVVLTDMAMPIMDGPELILELRAINPSVRIVGSSGFALTPAMARAASSGAELFIAKPYTGEALLSALQSAIGGAPPLLRSTAS